MGLTPERLRELRDKYQRLVVLRREREALEARGILRFSGAAAKARAAASRELATRFPAALRELDSLSAESLAARLAHVEAVLGGASPAPWLVVVDDLHATVARALSHKRRARGLDAAAVDDAEAMRYLSPSKGRMMTRVWQELSQRHRCSPAALRRLIFSAEEA